jgi:hypothetical protein
MKAMKIGTNRMISNTSTITPMFVMIFSLFSLFASAACHRRPATISRVIHKQKTRRFSDILVEYVLPVILEISLWK